MQIEPERFIAAVVAEPMVWRDKWNDPKRWPAHAGKPGGPSGIRRPVLALVSPFLAPDLTIRSLVRDAERAGAAAALKELPPDFNARGQLARAWAFREIEGFVNTHVYQFVVKLGDLKFEP